MVVKFQVERRPIGPTGVVYRGTSPGDYIAVLSNPKHEKLGAGVDGYVRSIKKLGEGPGQTVSYVPAGMPVPKLVDTPASSGGSTSTPASKDYTHVMELSGEPWLVHSSHYSVDGALEAAAPLAAAIGADNIRIIKVLSHTTSFNLK